MSCMFSKCFSLKDLNIDGFNTSNVKNFSFMFSGCLALSELNVKDFDIGSDSIIILMFINCSDEIKKMVRNQNKNLRRVEAFED